MLRPAHTPRLAAASLLAAAAFGLGACTSGAATDPPVHAAASSPGVISAPESRAVPETPDGVETPSAAETGVLPTPAGAGPGAVPSGIPLRQATPEAAAELAQPVRVQVEGTGIDLEVVPVGVEDNGAMSIPGNHYQAGWYRFGSGPGAASGAAVLAAHVDSKTESLPIAGLKDVPPGRRVIVTLADGTAVVYQTKGVEHIAKRSLDGHRLFDRTGEPVLKLVTCGGQWLDAKGDYEDNVVLTAAPLS